MPDITCPVLLEFAARLAAMRTRVDIETGGAGLIMPRSTVVEPPAPDSPAVQFHAACLATLLGGCRKSGGSIKAVAARGRDRPILGIVAREKVRAAVEDAMLAGPEITGAVAGGPAWLAVRDAVVAAILEAGAGREVSDHDIDRLVRAAGEWVRVMDLD